MCQDGHSQQRSESRVSQKLGSSIKPSNRMAEGFELGFIFLSHFETPKN